jgi:hypothetical protein
LYVFTMDAGIRFAAYAWYGEIYEPAIFSNQPT